MRTFIEIRKRFKEISSANDWHFGRPFQRLHVQKELTWAILRKQS